MRILLILSAFFFLSCKKTSPGIITLSPETQTGANTFSCKIDGQIWDISGNYCYNQSGNCRENPLAYFYPIYNGTLSLTADRVIFKGLVQKSSESFDFSFYSNFSGTGIYHLKAVDSLFSMEYRNNTTSNFYRLLPDRETFDLTITKFDTLAKIVSGRFSGNLFNPDVQGDSIAINDGRFDVKLQ